MKAIIVFFDSLNRRYLKSYDPSSEIETPNFDRLLSKATVFKNSYVGSMPCIPARRELHTGRYNFLHREWGPIEPFDDSMPEILKKNGIYTHLISDHVHYWEDGGASFYPRYSSWEIVRGQEGDHWKGVVKEPDIPEVVSVPQANDGKGPSSLWRYEWVNRQYIKEEKDFPMTQTFNLGLEFIDCNKDSDNWMLQIETFDPHEPFFSPEKYRKQFIKDYKGKHFDWPRGKATQTQEEIEHVRNEYKALLSMCDVNLGKVLDKMDELNLWKDTLLIVGTDHGFLLGEHDYWGKNQMPYYNEVAHTPLYIHYPGLEPQPPKNQLAQLIDWAPTLLDYFNCEIPKDMQGKSLIPVLKEDAETRDAALYGVFSGHVNVTDGEYTYMRAALPELKDEVFNYTLMPLHMNKRFTVEELQDIELVPAFTFTKGVPVLKIKAEEKYEVSQFGNLLFNVNNDPHQLKPLQDFKVEEKMIEKLVKLMEETDAPEEQYVRLGLQGKK